MPVDPKLEPYRDAMRAWTQQLAQAPSMIPPLETREDVARFRAIGTPPFPAEELALPVELRSFAARGGEIPLRLFRPRSPRALYLDFHGGGFCMGWAQQKDAQNARIAAAAQVAVASFDYRLAPEHPFPDGPDDCEDAALFALEKLGPELGTARILLAGDSAGASLAALTALRLRERGRIGPVLGQVLVYGVFDLSMTPSTRRAVGTPLVDSRHARMFNDHFLPGRSPEERRDPAISPLYAELRGLPPTLFLVGEADPLLDDTLFLHARCEAAGVPCELQLFPDAPHGFASLPSPVTAVAEESIANFVRGVLR